MDVVLKSEIIVVVLEREEGVTLEEFSGLFHQVHGYQLSLKNYGYKSLKDLLDDMKDEVELKNVNGQQLLKYRPPPQHSVISPCVDISCRNDDPYMLDTSSVCCTCCSQSGDISLDEFPKMQPSSRHNAAGISGHGSSSPALQSNSQFGGYLTSDVYFTMDTYSTEMQTPSSEIVQIISQKLKHHPIGLRAAKLRQHILEQHKIDLENYSQTLGYTDMLSMLKEIPTIKFLNSSGKNIIIASCFYSNLVKDQHSFSANVELPRTGASSTSGSTALTQHSAQPDLSSNQKMANKEPLLNEASLSQEKPHRILKTCTETLHDPGSKADDLLKMRVNHTQKSPLHEAPTPTLLLDNHSNHSKQKSLNATHKENLDIVKIISETVISHHFGLKAKTLKQYMMSKHKIDLEIYSKKQGYTDMLSMLKQIPGIRFAEDSKSNLLIALVSNDKLHNSQPGQRKKDPLSWSKIADVLRRFPSGLRVEKLKQHALNIYHIDIEALGRELGYTDMLSMLKEVPGITSVNDDLFFASDSHKPKAKAAEKVNFSEKRMVDFLKLFSSGLTVKNLNRHMKNKNNIDLIKYSQKKGFPDVVCWLQTIPGVKVLNKNLVIASDVNKTYNSISKTKPAVTKNPNVAMKTPQGSQSVPKPSTTGPTGTGQQTLLPIFQIPLTNAVNNIHPNVQQGLRRDVSYASACAGNLRRNQINVQSQQNPPIFNVQKAHTAKATLPNYKEVPKAAMPSSKIKDNLQLLLKSHANGLSIFQLKKLYLLKFQQPFVPKGSSARKFLMGMKDVAKIKGVGVQMKVIPVLSEDTSASANTHRDSTPQEASALQANDGRNNDVLTHLQVSRPLSTLSRTEQINHSILMPLNSNQPSSLVCNQTESNEGFILLSTSENINQKQHLYHNHGQQMAEIGDKKMVTTAISNQANSSGVWHAQFSKTHEPPSTDGFAGILSDAQWPSLPQKFNIIKEITQGTKMPEKMQKNIPKNEQNQTITSKIKEKVNITQTLLQGQQDPLKTNGKKDHKQEDQTPEMHENISNNESFFTQNPNVTSKPQRKDNIAQTLLQESYDPFKAKGKTHHKLKDPTSEKHENISNNKVFFKQNPTVTSKPQQKVNIAQTLLQGPQDPFKTNGKNDHKQKGQTSDLVHPTLKSGFSFVMEEAGFSFVMEEATINKDQKSFEIGRNMNATPLQLNQPVNSNMAALTKGNAPESNRRPVNDLTQQKMVNLSSKIVTQQTNNDLVTSGTVSSICSMPNQKCTDSQPQKQTTSICNKRVDPLELKSQQALLQSQGMQPSCTGGQVASMPSKKQLETSSSKGICDFVHRESTSMPPKLEVTKSKSTKKVPNSKTVTKVGAQHIPTEKSTSKTQTTSINQPKSSPVSHVQQNLPGNPSVNAKGSPISHKLHKDSNLNFTNGQIIKQEHSQTKDGVDEAKSPLLPAQQKASTDHVYESEQTIPGPFQTHAKVPHPHTRLPVEQSQPLIKIPSYYNGTAEKPLVLGRSCISKQY